ncbi:MAG: hypothetical protein IJX27_00015 [Clostridia bacterium]|nr:hypothetical protein [Clostridia bacterium]
MKKIFSLLLAVFFVFSLCSCSESVNMAVLTAYQNGGFEAELKITAGGHEYRAALSKNEERLFLSFREPAALESFTFIFDEKGTYISTGGEEIPFSAGGLFCLAEVYSLFTVPVAGTWKIEKARPGGVPLYICENESTVLYIDANSRLPLKIVSGEIVADVLSFKTEAKAK